MRQPALSHLAYLVAAMTISGSLAFSPSTSSAPNTPLMQQRQQQKYRTANQHNNHFHTISNDSMLPSPLFSSYAQRRPAASSSATSLSMVPQIAAVAGCISGGFFAGGLHAIAGPDHLAALLPRCCGERWFKAGRVGALWGMGHGVSATILGVVAFALKNTFQSNMGSGMKKVLSGASHVTEIAVGLSLILIGVMGIREAREWEDEAGTVDAKSLSAAAAPAATKQNAQKRAVIFNGLLHGFSWDGAPSLAPAIAVASWSGNLAFLSAYAAGTMAAMAVVTTLVGEGTRKAGQFFDRPDIPQKLSLFSSVLAMVIGGIWVRLAFA